MRVALVGLLAVSAAVAAPVPKDFKAKADDQSRIVGRWQRLPPNGTEVWEFLADGTARLSSRGPNEPPIHFAVDPTAAPKTFLWKPSWGTWNGVYELAGDELRIALVGGNGPRPVAARPGTGHEFYEFRRLK